MAHARKDLVRVVVVMPDDERDPFDLWCRHGGKPRLTMTAAARELFRMASAGKIKIDREHARKMARTAPPKPDKKPK